MIGMIVGLATSLTVGMLAPYVLHTPGVAWTWNVAVGAITTFVVGLALSGVWPRTASPAATAPRQASRSVAARASVRGSRALARGGPDRSERDADRRGRARRVQCRRTLRVPSCPPQRLREPLRASRSARQQPCTATSVQQRLLPCLAEGLDGGQVRGHDGVDRVAALDGRAQLARPHQPVEGGPVPPPFESGLAFSASSRPTPNL